MVYYPVGDISTLNATEIAKRYAITKYVLVLGCCSCSFVFMVVESHSNNNRGRWGDVWQPTCWFGFFFCLLCVSTFFVFKKQRKFPNCLLGAMCTLDMLHFFRELLKGIVLMCWFMKVRILAIVNFTFTL